MKEKISYNIHDIVKIEMNRVKRLELLRDLDLRFSYFETDKVKNPDIVLNLGEFEPENRNCTVIDHKFYIKDNYFYCKESEERARWEVEIFGIERGQMVVNFNGMVTGIQKFLAPDIISQHFMLRNLIEWKLFQKHALMLHAGSIEKDGKAYLFAGRGGALKTTIIMNLIRDMKLNYIGDEYVIIKNGKALSFPAAFQEFLFRFENLPTENIRKDRRYRDLLSWFFYLRNHSSPENYRNPIIKVSDSAKLNSIFFINRGAGYSVKKVSYSPEHTARKMFINTKLESINGSVAGIPIQSNPFKYLLAYEQVFPESRIASYWNRVEYSYKKAFRNANCYEAYMPYKYDPKFLGRFDKFIR